MATFARFWVNPNGSAASFTADYRGIGAMLCDRMLYPELIAHAEAIKVRAEAIAPRSSQVKRVVAEGEKGTATTPYAESFSVGHGLRPPGDRHRHARVRAWVVNEHQWAKSVEYGQPKRGIKAHRTLRRAAESAT